MPPVITVGAPSNQIGAVPDSRRPRLHTCTGATSGRSRRTEPRSRFTLVYGNRRQSSILFQEELEDLKDRYLTRFALYHVFSREQQDVPLFNGRLDRAKVRTVAYDIITSQQQQRDQGSG